MPATWAGVRFTRHTKNKARFYKVGLERFEAIVLGSVPVEIEAKGKPVYEGVVGGTTFRVVVALDEPDLIVTIYRRRR